MTLGRLRLSVADARDLAEGTLRGIGYRNDEPGIIADHVIDAAMCGYEYSGLAKILNVFESEHFRLPRRSMKVLRETEVSLAFDGGNNVGMLALFHAAQATIKKTAAHGVALVTMTDTWMSGRGAYYVEMIAKHGLVAIHTASSSPLVAPPGGIGPVLGTNPIAIAVPLVARTARARYGHLSLHDDRGDATRTAWRVTSRRRRARPRGRGD
jgi:LDH2 family malate/lactate/ureidoglycolate dehydrogenase